MATTEFPRTERPERVGPPRAPAPGGPRGTPRPGPGRLKFGFLVIAIVLSFYAARLVQLQAIDPGSYAEKAAAEGLEEMVLPAERGAIRDRNGVELATSMDGLMVIADPQLASAKASELATFLAAELDVDYFTTLERLRKTEGEGSRYQFIARRVPATKARAAVAKAKAQGFAGLTTERDPIRTYPLDDVAANLIGFIGQDDKAGALSGFERTFNKVLAGTDGSARYQVVEGRRVPLGESAKTDPRNGHDLVLTIDRDTQWHTQRVLAQAVRQWNAESATAIVMDSRSGELLSYADYPTFDANHPQRTDEDYYGSKGASEPYEPGSVEKVLTLAAVMDAGKATPESRLNVPPGYQANGHTIGDHGRQGYAKLTLAGVLAKSSNIGTALAADLLEDVKLREYLTAFGLGQRTNIGIRGESPGSVPPAPWTDISQATIAFGQGLSVTPIQLAAAFNTIANKGVRVSPSLIEGSATTDAGVQVGTEHATSTRVVSEDTARKMALMMEKVVGPEGTASKAAIDNYRIAGKTGTAQVPGPDGRYLEGVDNNSFCGFAPADNPRFTVCVTIKSVQGGAGGSTAGPPFRKIMNFVLRHYAVPPTTGSSPYELTWGAGSDR